MIKTIFFDIGGVLLNIYPDRTIKYLSSITKLSEQIIIDSFPEESHNQYERGEISDTDFFNAVKNNLPDTNGLTNEQFWNAWSMLVGDETGVVDIMNNLTKQYSVWLLSNTNPYHIVEEERYKLFDKITGGIYSFEVGSRKPEEEIFNKALELANTEAISSLFIDDLNENVEKARSLNFNAIQFTSINDLNTELAKFGIK